MKKLIFFIFSMSAMSVLAQGNDTDEAQKSSAMPIDLVADKGSYDQQAGIAIYEGNVRVTQGVATIWANKLTITLKNNAAERLDATGSPVKFEYKGQKQPIYGQGKRVSYQVTNKTVTLTGSALIEQGSDKIKGAQLTYNLDKEVIGGSRVKMTFLPKKGN